ncbi:MAG: hypothetical protein MR687_01135 [Spirochaetales bacterium]|nr:hypothetical protein [Spirochaetales bacterium]
MKKIRNIFILILCSLLLFSCNKKEEEKVAAPVIAMSEIEVVAEEKIKVSVYCYDVALLKGLTPLLEERFPEVDLEVITGVNDISFLTMVNEHGDLPDIMCMRRFSLNDAKYIRSNLMDLSRTEVAATFHSSILEQNRDEDGSIRWLPSCAEVDGLLADRKLFEENGLELPTNYEEFENAMEVFKEKGITPFISDFRYDYTCLELLQGVSISQLMTLEGIEWRQKYESEKEGEHVTLDENVWLSVFEKFYSFLETTGVDEKDVDNSFIVVNNEFNSRNAAIARNTAAACAGLAITNPELDPVMIPFYGETENDNWILTYPTYQVAVSKKVEENSKKKQIVLDMVSLMLSEEGELATVQGAPLLSYTMTNQLELSPVFDTIMPEIERNHIYMRLASLEFFNASMTVVQGILKGQYPTPRDAFEAFNELLLKDSATDDTIVYTSDIYEPYGMTETGNRAESSTLNLIREGLWVSSENKRYAYTETEGYEKTEVAISFSGLNATPVFKDDYTLYMLNNVICPRKTVYIMDMTGAEIDQLLTELINVRENGSNPLIHENMLPAASGFSYSVKDNGDGTFQYCGSDLKKDRVYKGLCIGNITVVVDNTFANAPISRELRDKLISVNLLANTAINNLVKQGYSFKPATPYLTFL